MAKNTVRTSAARKNVLNSPLLRKCSVHKKSRKVQRRDDKAALRKQWSPQSTLMCVLRAPLNARASLQGVAFTCG